MAERCRWKVPFRRVYCDSFASWVKATLWCHFVIRVWPEARDLGSDALVEHYIDKPAAFFEQYEFTLRRIAKRREAPSEARPYGAA